MNTAVASTSYRRLNLKRMWSDAPGFTALAMLLVLTMIPLYAAWALDSRLFQGESPWLKPIKFQYALSIYAISLAFFARYVRPDTRAGRSWQIYTAVVMFAIVAEVIWVNAAAMFNIASHFNTNVPAFKAFYPIAGLLAVVLTSASLVLGIAIWRNPSTGLPQALRDAISLGLILTFFATVIVAGYLSSSSGHHIGTSTRQLWLMGWSRDAGDLRVAHFFATHALHFVPLNGLLAVRWFSPKSALRVVWLACAGYIALVISTFIQAINGQPFLRFLG